VAELKHPDSATTDDC